MAAEAKTHMRFLVTGAAGFIGFHVAQRLCRDGHEVVGIDNLNDYYSVALKQARLDRLLDQQSFSFHRLDIADARSVRELFEGGRFQRVIHLAAQPGVRYSVENPAAYTEANISGFLSVLEACRHVGVEHLVYASSSSVYGMNRKMPFSTTDAVDHPASLYAATKRANELMAYTYAHMYGLPATGLRFFTVYGPWGRPDMAIFKFTRAVLNGEPIDVYHGGAMSRDFTYIDDIVEALVRVQAHIPVAGEGGGAEMAPARVYNLGLGAPVRLLDFIGCIEAATGLNAIKRYLPMQPGDICDTWADMSDLQALIDFRPQVALPAGVECFVAWYRGYYSV